MHWLCLILTIICEVIGNTFLKLSSEGGKYANWYLIGVLVYYAACFTLLGFAMKHFSVGMVHGTS